MGARAWCTPLSNVGLKVIKQPLEGREDVGQIAAIDVPVIAFSSLVVVANDLAGGS
ncbi:hypothetical protein [Thiobaca trueperi]|uniref:hypothetical protein n=1 Tax=Thiobaca trueperi TaxID=127458 RepID=UPI001404A094|nr:hypothetical protein [Thiobaca trueperi]